MSIRTTFADPGDRNPRVLWFLVKYNWETRETTFLRFDDSEVRTLYEGLGPNETLHRCEVDLSYPPKQGIVDDSINAKELYIENDRIDANKVTAADAVNRINSCRLFPILPSPGLSIQTRRFEPEALAVSFAGRTFIVSVKEQTP